MIRSSVRVIVPELLDALAIAVFEYAPLDALIVLFAFLETLGLAVEHHPIGTVEQTLAIFFEAVGITFQNAFA